MKNNYILLILFFLVIYIYKILAAVLNLGLLVLFYLLVQLLNYVQEMQLIYFKVYFV